MASPRFLARINEHGHIVPAHPERFIRRAGQDLWVSTHSQPTIGVRSDRGNRYLWGVVYGTISLETGNDPEAIHYGLKRKAIVVGVLEPEFILSGSTLLESEPTTVTDSDTFWRYVDWIRHEAEHGTLLGTTEHPRPLHIPEPNEGKTV